MTAKLVDRSGFRPTRPVFYKCNKNSIMVLNDNENSSNKTKTRRLAEEEEKKRLAEEEEAKRLAEEEEAKRLAEEEEAKRLAEEEARRLQKIEIYMEYSALLYADIETYVRNGGEIDIIEFSEIYAKRPKKTSDWSEEDLISFNIIKLYLENNEDFQAFHKQENLKREKLKSEYFTNLEGSLNNIEERLKQISRDEFGNNFGVEATEYIYNIRDLLTNISEKDKDKIESIIAITQKFIDDYAIQKKEKTEIVNYLEKVKPQIVNYIKNNFGSPKIETYALLVQEIDTAGDKNFNQLKSLKLRIDAVLAGKNDETEKQTQEIENKQINSELTAEEENQIWLKNLKKEQENLKNIETLEDNFTRVDELIINYNFIKKCYEARKGYMSVYITSDEFTFVDRKYQQFLDEAYSKYGQFVIIETLEDNFTEEHIKSQMSENDLKDIFFDVIEESRLKQEADPKYYFFFGNSLYSHEMREQCQQFVYIFRFHNSIDDFESKSEKERRNKITY